MKVRYSLWFGLLLAACADGPMDAECEGELTAHDLERGGRYFDKWFADTAYAGEFSPDDGDTPGVADGSGGPFADGTLPDAQHRPMLNDDGHDYRPKNFFGWDLRGPDGIYGPRYQDKATVLDVNLLADTRTREELAAWFTRGGEGLPAYGEILTAEEIGDLSAFVVAMREDRLARASDVWELSETAPSNYTLLPGADPEAGHVAYTETCATCHGVDGTTLPIDDGEYTLGSFARQKAYEGWIKLLVGHPGSIMEPQVPPGLDGREQAAWILDVLAALCDRDVYPAAGASEPDVDDGDPRCGEYLDALAGAGG